MSGDWRDEGACRSEDPGLFFDPDSDTPEPEGAREARETAAKAVCSGCPVSPECLEAGLPVSAGIWGGLTEDERRNLKANRRRRRLRGARKAAA